MQHMLVRHPLRLRNKGCEPGESGRQPRTLASGVRQAAAVSTWYMSRTALLALCSTSSPSSHRLRSQHQPTEHHTKDLNSHAKARWHELWMIDVQVRNQLAGWSTDCMDSASSVCMASIRRQWSWANNDHLIKADSVDVPTH